MVDMPYPEMKNEAPGNDPSQDQPAAKQEKKQQGGLFSSKPKSPVIDTNLQISSMTNIINDMSRRLRIMEEKFNNLDKKVKLNEENSVSNLKKVNMSIAIFHDDVNDFKKHIKLDEEKTDLIIKELKLSAKRDDVAVLQRYIEMWDPVKFATHNEIDKVIQEKIDELVQKQ
jgi:hypothetical protein